MYLGDFVTADRPGVMRRTSGRGSGNAGAHCRNPDFISLRIKARGHFEWTQDTVEEAAELWRDKFTKRQIADHFHVKLDSIIGMIFRNRAVFAKRKSGVQRK